MAEMHRLGKYEIQGVLGRGGMGTVYRARDPVIDRVVALKTIRRELIDGGGGAAMVERFHNEARAAGRLNHPAIVAIYDFGEDADVAYIAMEFVDGCGLGQYLGIGERLPVADVVSIMLQLLEALDYVHQRGVIHRDIKAANLLITQEGKLKITDFGIARIDTAQITQVGSIVGTPNAMAPEQFLGLAVDHRADLFSAGVVFYELLAGKRPFNGAMEAMAYQVCHEPHRPPSIHAPGLPAAFDLIIDRALAKRPDERYPDAAAFGEALREAYARAYSAPPALAVSEETVVLTAEAVRANLAAYQAGLAAGGLATGASGVSPGLGGQSPPRTQATQWQENTLKTVERQLAAYIGPLAGVIVRRAASTAHDLGELYAQLEGKLDTEEARRGLRDGLTKLGMRTGGQAPGSTGITSGGLGRSMVREATQATPVPTVPLAPADVEKAGRALARHLGPIAPVLAKKAATTAAGPADLYRALAEHIDDADARRRFLAEVGGLG